MIVYGGLLSQNDSNVLYFSSWVMLNWISVFFYALKNDDKNSNDAQFLTKDNTNDLSNSFPEDQS